MTGPVALMSAGGGAPVPPGDAGATGGKPVEGRPKLEKASLTLYDPSPPKSGKPGARRGAVAFQFNPKEVTIAKTAEWKRKPAAKAPKASPAEFTGTGPSKLTVEMFFDATASQDGSVVEAVEQLFSCCIPTEESLAKTPSPPTVVLHWGSISSFPAFVTSVSAKYTLFNGEGLPIRALVSVAMEELPNEPFRQNPTSGSAHVRRVHRTVAGDTLASVAYAEYGDPTQWRALAAFNGIDDPQRVHAGTTLLLPSSEELATVR
jgi:nucleoid-associated protein YgaU